MLARVVASLFGATLANIAAYSIFGAVVLGAPNATVHKQPLKIIATVVTRPHHAQEWAGSSLRPLAERR